jgi:uncharacterized membrane protein (UPF0136 family)
MVYLGYASLVGSLIHWLRREVSKDSILTGISFSALVFFPSTLSLPLPPYARAAAWAGALLLVVLFAVRPAALPNWFWGLRFGLRYGAVAMSLILLWSLIIHTSTWGLILGMVAGLAGVLAWRRSRVIEA